MFAFKVVFVELISCCSLIKKNYSKCVSSILNGELTSREEVRVNGWVKSVREYKKFSFVDINDGSTFRNLQVVVSKALCDWRNFTVGSSVSVSGKLKANEKNRQVELVADECTVLGHNPLSEGYPFLPRKTYDYDYIRKFPEFRSRTSKFSTIFRIRSSAAKWLHDYFEDEGFLLVHMPILTGNDCEGAGETFVCQPKNSQLLLSMQKNKDQKRAEVFFDREAYLTVSSQLHLESMAHSFCKVYHFGPTFRAENSRSRFHLSEFYMLEAEQAFVLNEEPILLLIERMLKSITKKLMDKYGSEVEKVFESASFGMKIRPLLDHSFVRITHEEASRIVRERFPVTRPNFSKEEELYLVEYFENVPVFVTDWPAASKPFYMKRSDEGKQSVRAYDLLVPNVGELVGGGVRENDCTQLSKNMTDRDIDSIDWYLSLRKFGSVPTAGFGLGFERFLQFFLDLNSIKDTIAFPRWPHNCQF